MQKDALETVSAMGQRSRFCHRAAQKPYSPAACKQTPGALPWRNT